MVKKYDLFPDFLRPKEKIFLLKNNHLSPMVGKVLELLKNRTFDLSSEKALQYQLEEILKPLNIKREYRLSKKDIVDFFIEGLAIEVKIKGSAKNIYRQCQRYAEHEEVREILLITGVSMGFPEEINGKSAYYFSLTRNML